MAKNWELTEEERYVEPMYKKLAHKFNLEYYIPAMVTEHSCDMAHNWLLETLGGIEGYETLDIRWEVMEDDGTAYITLKRDMCQPGYKRCHLLFLGGAGGYGVELVADGFYETHMNLAKAGLGHLGVVEGDQVALCSEKDLVKAVQWVIGTNVEGVS